MASAVREISSSAPAQALVEPRAKPPNAIAAPTIACRRVVPLVSADSFVLSLIIVLQAFAFRRHRIRASRDNMFKIILPGAGELHSRHASKNKKTSHRVP